MVYYPSIGINDELKFKLASPSKGQLKVKKLFSAYSKKSLSSIPSNCEKYLINQSNDVNANDYTYKELGKMANSTKNNSLITPTTNTLKHISLKGYGNGFASKLNRFDNIKHNNDMYSPGPGQYKVNSSILNKNKLRYKSLFNAPIKLQISRKKKKKQGPSFYSPELNSSINKPNDDSSTNLHFCSRDARFKEVKKKKLGPGSYELVEIKKWNSNNPSSFFKTPTVKKVNTLDKYIKKRETAKDTTPGPGEYLLKREFDEEENKDKMKMTKSMSYSYLLSTCQDNSLVPQELKEFNTLIKEELRLRNNMFISHKINTDLKNRAKEKGQPNKEVISPFLSNSKKTIIYDNTANHIPGPCYYQRNVNYYNLIEGKKPIKNKT